MGLVVKSLSLSIWWQKSLKSSYVAVDALVPLVDILDIDCLHDVDPPITMLHASMISPCDDLPIYDEYDDCHVESISCDAMLHRISCDNSLGHIMFDNPLKWCR